MTRIRIYRFSPLIGPDLGPARFILLLLEKFLLNLISLLHFTTNPGKNYINSTDCKIQRLVL